MEFVFKVITQDKKILGYVQDPLLNLCRISSTAAKFQAKSINDIRTQAQQYQQRLNKVLDFNKTINSPVSNIAERVYKNNYINYNCGDLNIIPENSDINSF